MEFIEKHLNAKFYLEGTQRINIRNKIFREVCANLLIHREFYSAYPAKLIIEEDIFKQILPIKEQKTPETTTEKQKHHRKHHRKR